MTDKSECAVGDAPEHDARYPRDETVGKPCRQSGVPVAPEAPMLRSRCDCCRKPPTPRQSTR
eukprot:2611990-Heterocapsa_arctica.AAC.1